eukprot:6195253-Pleurochrysis_carterae.AAC.2
MAVERQKHRIRRGSAGDDTRRSSWTKLITKNDRAGRAQPEKLRCASLRPRDGQQWALGEPSPGTTQAGPELHSQKAFEQRTRARAGAHAGPEPAYVSGRNPHETGNPYSHRTHAWSTPGLMMVITMSLGVNGMAQRAQEENKAEQQWWLKPIERAEEVSWESGSREATNKDNKKYTSTQAGRHCAIQCIEIPKAISLIAVANDIREAKWRHSQEEWSKERHDTRANMDHKQHTRARIKEH